MAKKAARKRKTKATHSAAPAAAAVAPAAASSMWRSLKLTCFVFTICAIGHCFARYSSIDKHVCRIEGPLLPNDICNNYATKKAPGALYQIEQDEFACHPFKPTGTQKPTFDFYDKMYIGNPHDHPQAKIDFVLSRGETFLGGMNTKIKNEQSSHVITPWTGKSVSYSSTSNFIKVYMWVYDKILSYVGTRTRTIKRVWSEQNSGEPFKFFYFKHPKSPNCQRKP